MKKKKSIVEDEEKDRFTIYMEKKLHEKAKEMAKKNKRSLSSWLSILAEEAIKK